MDLQNIIQDAYGEYWEQLSNEARLEALQNFGWIHYMDTLSEVGEDLSGCLRMDFEDGLTRPTVLRGLETNNGWVKVDSADDLPSVDADCRIRFHDGSQSVDTYRGDGHFIRNSWKHISHYKILTDDDSPLY